MIHFLKTSAAWVLCIFVMQYLHELGHALTAKALGYDVMMSINRVSEVIGAGYAPAMHANLVSGAGPAVTIILALLAYIFRARLGMLAPIIIGNALVMRILASAASFNHPNDEARLSANLGLPMWTLPALVCASLLMVFILAIRGRELGWRWYLTAWLGVSVGYATVILGEAYLPTFAL